MLMLKANTDTDWLYINLLIQCNIFFLAHVVCVDYECCCLSVIFTCVQFVH